MSSRAADSTPPRPVRPPRPPGASGRGQDGPRRVRHGLKLQLDPEDLRDAPGSRAWLDAVASAAAPHEIEAGLEYARLGQVTELEIGPGDVQASVQGMAPRPYTTRLEVVTLTPRDWDRLITAMAGESIYTARLPAGELPDSIHALAAAAGIDLLPEASIVTAQCTCAAEGTCRHASAVAFHVAARLHVQPQLLFTLRGMPPDRVVDRLRQVRAIETRGVAAAHADPLIAESQVPPPPLESCLEDFWRSGPRLAELEDRPAPAHVEHALLRRLGPSPMNGRFPMAGLLASIYDAVSASARRQQDQSDRDEK